MPAFKVNSVIYFFRGEYEIAEGTTAAVFNAVLAYYHTGVIHCPPHVPVLDLRDACDYFLLPFNAATVKCQVIKYKCNI